MSLRFLFCMLFIGCTAFGQAQDINGNDIFPDFKTPIKYPAITPDGKYMVFSAADEKYVTIYGIVKLIYI